MLKVDKLSSEWYSKRIVHVLLHTAGGDLFQTMFEVDIGEQTGMRTGCLLGTYVTRVVQCIKQ